MGFGVAIFTHNLPTFNFVLQMVSCLLLPEFSIHHSACGMVLMLLSATQPQSWIDPLTNLTARQVFGHQILQDEAPPLCTRILTVHINGNLDRGCQHVCTTLHQTVSAILASP